MPYKHALERLLAAIGPAETARRFGVSDRTIRRWRAGTSTPHTNLQRLIELETAHAFGDLPPPWQDFRVARDGRLYDRAGNCWEPGDLYAELHARLNGAQNVS